MPEAQMTDEQREEKWKAEGDAHTLSEAEVIRGDEKRLEKAQEAAIRLAKEAEEQASAMKDVARGYDLSKFNLPPKKF